MGSSDVGRHDRADAFTAQTFEVFESCAINAGS